MICKFCGNLIEDNSEVCFICGKKVEAAEAPAADGFAPVAAPVAPVAPVEAAPVYAAPVTAPVAPVAPVYAAPVAAAPVAPELSKDEKKAAKKAKLSKGRKFFTFLFAAAFIACAFIASNLFYVFAALTAVYAFFAFRSYKKAVKLGYTDKAKALVNTSWVGVCAGMAIACIFLLNKGFLS